MSGTRLLKYLKDTRTPRVHTTGNLSSYYLFCIVAREQFQRSRDRDLQSISAANAIQYSLEASPILLSQSRMIILILRRYRAQERKFLFLLHIRRIDFSVVALRYVAARWSGFITPGTLVKRERARY